MDHLNNQNMEITKIARDRFVESLSHKAMRNLQEFNALKGGDKKTLDLVDSKQ